MRRQMFGDIADPSVKVGTKQWYTVPFSILVHTLIIGAMVIVPLMATDVLPTIGGSMSAFVATPPPPPPPPPPPTQAVAPKAVEDVNPNAPPIEAPTNIRLESPDLPYDREPPIVSSPGVVGGGGFESATEVIPPPPPPPAPKSTETVIVGGNIKPPMKTRDARPVYPSIAQSARVQGVVIIQTTIGVDGRVQDARVLRSIPLLDQAAIDAVRQWEFTPTTLNGTPVAVMMTVTVQFSLN